MTAVLIVVLLVFTGFMDLPVAEDIERDLRRSSSIKVWFESNSARVGMHDAVRTTSAVWDGKRVKLSAARNEFEPIQLVINSPNETEVKVECSDFSADENIIPAGNCKIYKVVYVQTREKQKVPDPLVPVSGQFRVAGGVNTPVWIRMYIPSSAAPGEYAGNIKISSGLNKHSFPVSLVVRNFALPERSSLFRVSPHWESSSFVKETYGKPVNYEELVYLFYRELKRMGISPAQSFDLKKAATMGMTDNEEGMRIDFSRTDKHISFLMDSLKFNNIDVEFYYSPLGVHDPKRRYPLSADYSARVRQYLQVTSGHYRKKKWYKRMWIQHYGDEPCQTCKGGEHLKPSYQAVRDWSDLFRAGAPDLNILISEHPTPQLFGAVDIWNAQWHLLKRADVRERHREGEMVIAYSCDSKVSKPLISERINLWNIYAEEADGCWSWHLYKMGDFNSENSNRRYSAFYNGKQVGVVDEPVISLRGEMMGEAKDDWDYLELIEDRFGSNMAQSIARIVADRPGPPGKGRVDSDDIYNIRDFMGSKLESEQPLVQDDFIDFELIEDMKNLVLDGRYEGHVKLDYAEPYLLIEDFEQSQRFRPRGPATAEMDYNLKTEGQSSAKVVFRRGRSKPDSLSFAVTDLPVADWSEYGLLEFDIYASGNYSLFDISLSFNDEFGRGYNIKGSVDWKKGDQVHSVGQFSENGSFPGAWRHVVVDLDEISGKYSFKRNRRNIRSVYFRMGSGGSVNEPLPDVEYVFYLDNLRLQKKKYKKSGKIVSAPLLISSRPLKKFEWIGDFQLPEGTNLRFYGRTGSSQEYDVEKWSEWEPIEAAAPFDGKFQGKSDNYLQYKVEFESDGRSTPVLRAVSIY